jgi:hypothetical protein
LKETIITACLWGVASLAAAQSPVNCTPAPFDYAKGCAQGQQACPQAGPQGNPGVEMDGFVPSGQVWIVEAASASVANESRVLEYAMQMETLPGGNCCYLFGLEKSQTQSTPVITLSRRLVLRPGTRLSVRVNSALPQGATWTGTLGIGYSGWIVPEACLSRVLGLDAPVVSGEPGPAPDFSALIQAAAAATTALSNAASSMQQLSQAVPPPLH